MTHYNVHFYCETNTPVQQHGFNVTFCKQNYLQRNGQLFRIILSCYLICLEIKFKRETFQIIT